MPPQSAISPFPCPQRLPSPFCISQNPLLFPRINHTHRVLVFPFVTSRSLFSLLSLQFLVTVNCRIKSAFANPYSLVALRNSASR
ncbi:hypothetical protein Pfo_019623 [Paulownia fortunei]|nr:hypothetical protein Pfo_019623 [Paulownia fortunei]